MDNPVKYTDPKGKEVVAYLLCEGVNAIYTAYSTIELYNELTESIALLRDQLLRVNKALANCDMNKNFRKWATLTEMQHRLSLELEKAVAQRMPMSMSELGPGMVRAGECGVFALVPLP